MKFTLSWYAIFIVFDGSNGSMSGKSVARLLRGPFEFTPISPKHPGYVLGEWVVRPIIDPIGAAFRYSWTIGARVFSAVDDVASRIFSFPGAQASESSSGKMDRVCVSGEDCSGVSGHEEHDVVLSRRSFETLPEQDFLFIRAIREGNIEAVSSLIAQGTSVSTNAIEPPLTTACAQGQKEIAKLLLEKGAPPNPKRSSWHLVFSPMEVAARRGDKELVSLLQGYGASLDDPNPFTGETPVYVAIDHGHEELALFFIDQGAEIRTNQKGKSLIRAAVESGLLKVTEELLRRGVDVNEISQDTHDITSLLGIAVARDNPGMVDLLLKHGARRNVNLALPVAIEFVSLRMVKKLVEFGADLSLQYEGLDLLAYAKKQMLDASFGLREERHAIVEYLRQDQRLRESEALATKDESKSSSEEIPQEGDAELLHFPSEDAIISCFERLVEHNDLNRYLYEEGIIPIVAHEFANQEKFSPGVDIGVFFILADLQEKLRIPEPAILAIRMNLAAALKECALGK